MLGGDLLSLVPYWMLEQVFHQAHDERAIKKLKIKIGQVDKHVRGCPICQSALNDILKKELERCLPQDLLEIAAAFRVISHYPDPRKEDLAEHFLNCAGCQEKTYRVYKLGLFAELD